MTVKTPTFIRSSGGALRDARAAALSCRCLTPGLGGWGGHPHPSPRPSPHEGERVRDQRSSGGKAHSRARCAWFSGAAAHFLERRPRRAPSRYFFLGVARDTL